MTRPPGGTPPSLNPFNNADAARAYAAGRPFYHSVAVATGVSMLNMPTPVFLGVDIGCGTGLSTRALGSVCKHVVGLDVSATMLESRNAGLNEHFIVASAEHLGLADSRANLVTAGASLHWCDQNLVLAEAARILRQDGGLIVYTDFFHGGIAELPDFQSWFKNVYLERLPEVPRGPYFNAEAALQAGLIDHNYAEKKIEFVMTPKQIIEYLLSQSYALTAIHRSETTKEALSDQISNALKHVAATDRWTANFGLRVWTARLYRRADAGAR